MVTTAAVRSSFTSYLKRSLTISRQITLPARSLSHPRDTHTSGRKGENMGAFDPDELCKRLEGLRRDLRESHRRRHKDAEKQKKPEEYHHIPQVAARDFAKTTTPHALKDKDVHKLSRSVLKKYKRGSESNGPWAEESQRHLGKAGQSMDFLAERNQFQRTPALESAARVDKGRNATKINPLNVRDCDVSSNDHIDLLRSIRGEEITRVDASNIGTECSNPMIHHPKDRHDWTQRDESEGFDRNVLKDLVGPLFRRASKTSSTCNALADLPPKDVQGKRASRRRFNFFS